MPNPLYSKSRRGGRKGSSKRKLNKKIDFDREGQKGNARKRETELVCSNCRRKFTLPFKPRKPEVYCDNCFKKP